MGTYWISLFILQTSEYCLSKPVR